MEKERYLKYVKICERAERMKIDTGDRMGTLMDIESADKKFNMRLDDWLQADDFNFAHDYCGIQNNIKRGEFPATDFGFFLPRFAGTHKKPKRGSSHPVSVRMATDALTMASRKTASEYREKHGSG